jgi:small subunit ribosomal protein S33
VGAGKIVQAPLVPAGWRNLPDSVDSSEPGGAARVSRVPEARRAKAPSCELAEDEVVAPSRCVVGGNRRSRAEPRPLPPSCAKEMSGSKAAALSGYAKRMDRLSRRIFGDVVRSTDDRSVKVVRLFGRLPMEQNEWYATYYPPHPMLHYLTKMLRLHGLYRDEHHDFQQEMVRLATLRGKGPPKIGEGKKAKLRKEGAA